MSDGWIEVSVKAWARREDVAAVKSTLLINGYEVLRREGFTADQGQAAPVPA